MAIEGMIWKLYHLESHLRVFPQDQFVAEYGGGQIVGSISSLIVQLEPEYQEHTWAEICGGPEFRNHDSKGDSLYGLMYRHIQTIVGLELQHCSTMQERTFALN